MLQYFNPLAWGRWIGQFFSAWILSIPWRDAPKAIPALVLLITVIVTGAIALTEGSGWRSRKVARQYAQALEVDDFETAELILRRQVAADPQDADLRFRLAVNHSEKDEREQAIAIMRDLVSFKRHEGAARWLLQEQYVGRKWVDLSQEERDEYGELLKLIHDGGSEEPAIKRLLAGYYIDTRRPAKAVPLLVELSRQFPVMGLQAAAIERQLGNAESADELGERTLAVLRKQYEEEPANSALALLVAQTQLFLERYEDAIRTLSGARQLARDEDQANRLRQAEAESIAAYVTRIEQAPTRSEEDRLQIFKMLERALRVAPNNPRVLGLIADQLLASEETEGEAFEQLRRSLIEGASPGISHFIQGTAALMKDDVDKAVMHLEIAGELMPNSGAALNNLAVAMSAREEPDLESALQFADRAIELTPQPSPYFYETRGQILMRLGRYLKAVPDLERALAVPALAPKVHEALAVCYRELGDEELSTEHRQAAERKRSEEESS